MLINVNFQNIINDKNHNLYEIQTFLIFLSYKLIAATLTNSTINVTFCQVFYNLIINYFFIFYVIVL